MDEKIKTDKKNGKLKSRIQHKIRISEDEMILEFLLAELDSSRFSSKLHTALTKVGADKHLITKANLDSEQENQLRRSVFKDYRKYEDPDGLFYGLPNDIEWFKEKVSKKELLSNVFYIDYDYWVKLSKTTRLPVEAAKSIKEGIEIFGVSNQGFISAEDAFRRGKNFHKLILVSDGKKNVVLEGHLRITVYALSKDLLPENLDVIIGYSKQMANWDLF